jgi:uncharacterized protein
MWYNVAQLLKEPTGATRSYQLNEEFTGPHRIADLAGGPVNMLRTHQGVLVYATLDVRSTLSCSRCLSDFALPAVVDIEEEFLPTIDVNTGRKPNLQDEDVDGERIGEDHILDLSEVVRQSILTEVPMKPLCRSDCQGLCQSCGTDLNQGRCNCGVELNDPRWGALASLLTQGNT